MAPPIEATRIPICVLAVELDGDSSERLIVYSNDDPAEVVGRFGEEFDLSNNSINKLLDQVYAQIDAKQGAIQQRL